MFLRLARRGEAMFLVYAIIAIVILLILIIAIKGNYNASEGFLSKLFGG